MIGWLGGLVSKEEEREDNREEEEASSADIRTNRYVDVDGSEDRTVEERSEGERDLRLLAGGDQVRCRDGQGGQMWRTN